MTGSPGVGTSLSPAWYAIGQVSGITLKKPSTMSSRSTSVLMLVTGIAAGAALGILFAPKKGKDTRADLKKKGEDLYDRLKEMVGEAQETLADQASKAKEKVSDLRNDAQRTADQARSTAKV